MKKLSLLIAFTFVFSLVSTSYGFVRTEIITKEIKEKNKENRSEVLVKYPQIKHSNKRLEKHFNKKVVSMMMNKVKGFKKDVVETEKENQGTRSVGYDLTIDFQVEMIGKDFISISFGESTYLGGAHPNFQSYSLNYNLKNGKTFELKDMFKKNAGYLKTISAFSIMKISEKQGEKTEWIETGAAAKDKNFDSWTISQNGLKFLFDPYQVGPYAAGSFEVMMPYESLPVDIQSNWMKQIVADISSNASLTVKDLYLSMPTKFAFVFLTPDEVESKSEIKKTRKSWISKEDLKNGYLKIKTPDNPNPKEIIAVKREDEKYTVAFTNTVTDSTGTYGFVNLYAYEEGEWIKLDELTFPKLSNNYINAAVAHKNITPKAGNVGAYYLLSPNTISLACRTCNNDKEIILQDFKWDGIKFTSKDSFAIDTNPKTVKDYYLAMPMDGFYSRTITGEKFTDAAKLKQFREKFIDINDTKNGYMKVKGINEGWSEIALFKKKDGDYLISVASVACGPVCDGVVDFYTYERGKWTDVTEEVFPKMTEQIVNNMFNAKGVRTAESEDNHYLLLPRNGTTIKAACNLCKDGSGDNFILKEFNWTGEKFVAKK